MFTTLTQNYLRLMFRFFIKNKKNLNIFIHCIESCFPFNAINAEFNGIRFVHNLYTILM